MDGELAFVVGGVGLFALFVLYMVVRIKMDSRRERKILSRLYSKLGVTTMAELDYIERIKTFFGRGQIWYEYHMVFKCKSPIYGEYDCELPIKTTKPIKENDRGIYRIAYIPQYIDFRERGAGTDELYKAAEKGFSIEKYGDSMAMFADDAENYFSKGKRKY